MGSNYRICMCFTRKFKVTEPPPPPDVKEAFAKYSDGGSQMTVEQLRRFLIEHQGDSDGADAERIVEQVFRRRHHLTKFKRNVLSLEDFHSFLFSSDLNAPIGSQVHHDMTAPLSHYFIYTGHNSYLTGNQLSSDCSDIPIIKALERGVRVIELDIWPNSTKDDVNVLHGRTLTTPVEFIKCIKSIKEYAFVASPYPVIITLEDHLTPDLQAKVAQMLTQTFGEMLFCPETNLQEFPTPEELKFRVLISTKPPKEYLHAESFKPNGSQKEKESDEDVWGREPSKLTAFNENDDKNASFKSDNSLGEEDTEEFDQDAHPSEPPAYKSLIAIHAGKPKGGLMEALKVESGKVRRLSLSEQALEKAAERHGMDIVRWRIKFFYYRVFNNYAIQFIGNLSETWERLRTSELPRPRNAGAFSTGFTQQNILRVYPKGTRFTSTNYKPQNGWMHGAQMVAFNMQGYGRALWLMHGMYRANGGCGYVKKPAFLMSKGPHNEVFNPKTQLPVKKTLKVKVYMGDGWHLDFKQTHFDMYSPPDFYTKVGIAGVPADEIMKKTKKIEDNWTPVWNEEFTFPLTVPELALLRIEVHEYDMSEKDDFAGQTCLPVLELKEGIRAIPLCNHKGDKYNSSRLLMRFEFI